jgi:lipopolysaccharide biosynthesis protein
MLRHFPSFFKMRRKRRSVGLHVKNMHKNTSTDTTPNTNATSTQVSPLPNILMLGVLGLCTIGIIIAGYFHGKMHLLTVLKNAFSS